MNETVKDEASINKKEVPKRSPKYPIISLSTAIERVKQIYQKEQFGYVNITVLPARWGQRFNSYTTQQVAALKSFKLVDIEGSMNERNLRVSEWAYKIITNSSDKEAIIKQIALAPPIFKEFWEFCNKAGFPSDDTLKLELARGKNFPYQFTRKGIELFLKNFRETIEFAKLKSNDIIEKHSEQENIASDMTTINKEQKIAEITQARTSYSNIKGSHIPSVSTDVATFSIPIGTDVATISIPRNISKKSFDAIRKVLDAIEDIVISPISNNTVSDSDSE